MEVVIVVVIVEVEEYVVIVVYSSFILSMSTFISVKRSMIIIINMLAR